MSRTVFILGAGASAEAGAPVMGKFLDRAEEIKKSLKGEQPLSVTYQKVFDALADLRTIHEKWFLDTNNIEEILSIFEMACILGKLGRMDQNKISETYNLMKEFIASVVERSTAFMKDDKTHIFRPFGPFRNFAALIKNLEQIDSEKSRQLYNRRTAIITFNYDMALEWELRAQNINYEYCLEGKSSVNGIPILKLHGSVNWGKCGYLNCGKITANTQHNNFLYQEGNKHYFSGDSAKAVHCSQETGSNMPEIIPPTWHKSQPSTSFLNVWQNASLELGDAEEIIVIGYSLPPSDTFFKYLFAIGTNTPTRLKKFWVCDPSDEVLDRFEGIIGSTIKARFKRLRMKFSEFIDSNQRNELLQ